MGPEVELSNYLVPFEKTFLLAPALWRNNPTRVQLDWKYQQFTESNKVNIPKERGIYMFVVSHMGKWAPLNNYIMYVGQTGYRNPKRTLKIRYDEYLRDQRVCKRARIYEMLNLWKDDIYFFYSEVSKTTDLIKLEARLTECLMPPYSEGDIPVGLIKQAIKVLRGP